MSTGTSLDDVAALDRAGNIHEFRIPKDVYQQWYDDGLVQPLNDIDNVTGAANQELRFSSTLAEEMNKYKIVTE